MTHLLDVFVGLFDNWKGDLPFIHCYCFSKAEDIEADVKEVATKFCGAIVCYIYLTFAITTTQKRCESVLGCTLDSDKMEIFDVRDVAPKKRMLCISFQVPEVIAFSQKSSGKRSTNANEAVVC